MTLEGPEGFYASIMADLKRRGVACAITGGLACVQFGVTHYTQDCDIICSPHDAGTLFTVLQQHTYRGIHCFYRRITAPLHTRWLSGGYTAHFHWPAEDDEKPFLDVFGIPPRVSSRWQDEVKGTFAGLHVVAEMKRTRRHKDWDQATALGLKMLEAGDRRGWLHIFDASLLSTLLARSTPGPTEIQQRPVLQLAMEGSPLLPRAIQTEIDFWVHLDRIRLRVFEQASTEFLRAIRTNPQVREGTLASQHQALVTFAERLLPDAPLAAYGHNRIIEEAKQATAIGIDPALLHWLPSATIALE